MKATVLLQRDHETLLSLCERAKTTLRPNEKAAIFEQIRREFQLHSRIEEDLFYLELENLPSAEAPALVEQARAQHRELEDLLQQLAPNGGGRKPEAVMEAAMQKLAAHIEFEEGEIFAVARQHFSEYRMEELGLELEERRRFLRLSAA